MGPEIYKFAINEKNATNQENAMHAIVKFTLQFLYELWKILNREF